MFESLDSYIGPAAGVAAAFLWAVSAPIFAGAGKRISVITVNALRIVLSIGALALTYRLLEDAWVPAVDARQVLFLAVSGIVGLSLGDQALLKSLVDIGPRLSTLVMTTSPLFAVFFGWIVLGETLHPIAWGGIVLTMGGVAWVVLERPENDGEHAAHRVRGVLLAFVGAACQAGGLLLSKQGMGHGWLPEDERLPAQAATLVRMTFAGLGMIPLLMWDRWRLRKQRVVAGAAASGSGSRIGGVVMAASAGLLGSYLGVWMSLEAGDRSPLGVAQTLCSLTPIFIVPWMVIVYKERVSLRAVVGAVIAVAGSALLFYRP